MLTSGNIPLRDINVPVAADKEERAALLWVPPQARQVRGVVTGGMTLEER